MWILTSKDGMGLGVHIVFYNSRRYDMICYAMLHTVVTFSPTSLRHNFWPMDCGPFMTPDTVPLWPSVPPRMGPNTSDPDPDPAPILTPLPAPVPVVTPPFIPLFKSLSIAMSCSVMALLLCSIIKSCTHTDRSLSLAAKIKSVIYMMCMCVYVY